MSVTELRKSVEMIRQLNSESIKPEIKPVSYKRPSLSFLKAYNHGSTPEAAVAPETLTEKLQEFGITGEVVNVSVGPLITRYELRLDTGVKLSKVRSASEDLAVALMSDRVRIQAPIPGTSLVGIEVPNRETDIVEFKPVASRALRLKGKTELPIGIGVDITGDPIVLDLAKMPHLLIAGRTGAGKSVCLSTIILSLLYTKTPEECQLILVDPKRVEMTAYKGIPHLKVPVITEPTLAVDMFSTLVAEMEHRYAVLQAAGVRNIKSYKEQGGEMPYLVTVVDEMADLMMTAGKELEKSIVRLAQLARAVGIHLVLATQKPVVKVITGLIKSNMPSRISFQVASKTDSRVILDENGAERLAGRGDMLALHPGVTEPERLHGAWISDKEIKKITDSLRRR